MLVKAGKVHFLLLSEQSLLLFTSNDRVSALKPILFTWFTCRFGGKEFQVNNFVLLSSNYFALVIYDFSNLLF